MSGGYMKPFIPISHLRELRKKARNIFYDHPFDHYDLWLLLVRQEADRITIQELKSENERVHAILTEVTLASVNLANEKQKEIKDLKNRIKDLKNIIEDGRFDN